MFRCLGEEAHRTADDHARVLDAYPRACAAGVGIGAAQRFFGLGKFSGSAAVGEAEIGQHRRLVRTIRNALA